MKEAEDKPLRDDENKPETNIKPEIGQPEKFQHRLSDEEIVERQIESFELFKQTDDRAAKDRELKEKRRKEIVELQSGEKRTLESYRLIDPQPYMAIFGRDVPFFKQMFRVADIDHRYDPNSYEKPPIAGVLINEFIYRRFGKGIIPILRAKAILQGKRCYKFSQFFDVDDRLKILQFRDQAIEMMQRFERGQLYELREEYAITYRVEGFQYRLKL